MREATLNLRRKRPIYEVAMKATPLRPVAPARARRSRSRLSVEALQERHDVLVAERQELRRRASDEAALERNRLEIVHCQYELSHALIARYVPRARSAA
jgi:hypothetical protein